MSTRISSQTKNINENLTTLRRSKRGAVPPPRRYSPSPPPSPTKRRGRSLKRGPGRPRKNVDNVMPQEVERCKPGRPRKRVRVEEGDNNNNNDNDDNTHNNNNYNNNNNDGNKNHGGNNENNNNNDDGENIMDTSDDQQNSDDDDNHLDSLYHPNGLIMLANVSFNAQQQMEVDDNNEEEEEDNDGMPNLHDANALVMLMSFELEMPIDKSYFVLEALSINLDDPRMTKWFAPNTNLHHGLENYDSIKTAESLEVNSNVHTFNEL
ncbi:hypothetical protein Glove_19g408 [Diversispora epigaea]|uniref:Uncharacterized protein n=1 Tax=Diversispora epigaea TaxID=1348612 RepID=A0A397JX78_9GLOM|nr:hypothetical protein Glove_19g408 [Diversispora epigaea]